MWSGCPRAAVAYCAVCLPDHKLAAHPLSASFVLVPSPRLLTMPACLPPLPVGLHRVLFQDTAGATFLYNAEQDELMQLPDFEGSLQAAVWDGADPAVAAAVSVTGAVGCL